MELLTCHCRGCSERAGSAVRRGTSVGALYVINILDYEAEKYGIPGE